MKNGALSGIISAEFLPLIFSYICGASMSIEQTLKKRAGDKCELCTSAEDLSGFEVAPADGSSDQYVLLCGTCKGQIENPDSIDANHWRCLNDSMWSQEPAVQVMAYRQLKTLNSKGEGWANDLLDMLYLEEATQKWADAGILDEDDEVEQTKDVNGAILQAGDNVTLIKDLVVKGANFTAKQGTMVRGIGMSQTNPKHIEGKVNGSRIVIIAEYCKKA